MHIDRLNPISSPSAMAYQITPCECKDVPLKQLALKIMFSKNHILKNKMDYLNLEGWVLFT